MGNIYWAGALPGLVLATVVSIGLTLSLDRRHLRHILWLVPALHFAGAFVVGPALALKYGLLLVPTVGAWAPWIWLVTSLIVLGLLPGLWTRWTRRTGRSPRAALSTGVVAGAVVGSLVPIFVTLLAS